MSVDSLHTGITSQAIHPKQDAHGQPQREPRRDGAGGSPKKDRQEHSEPPPVLNGDGQVMGRTINICV